MGKRYYFLAVAALILLGPTDALEADTYCPGYCDADGCKNCDIASADPADLSPDDLQYLNDAQKAQFWGKIPSYDDFDEPTIRQNMKYIKWGDQRLVRWMQSHRPLPNQFWGEADKLDGKKDDPDMWRMMMDDESIDAWMANYKFGDIVRFFAGLEFDEMIAAIVAFLTGDYDMPEPVHMPPEVLEEALQQSGYNVEELDYPSDTQLQLIDDHLIINGNNISLERLETGTHTITVNDDKTVNIESTEAEEEITIKGATGLIVEADGDFTIESAESVKIVTNETQTTIVNGKGITYKDGKLTAEQAEII